MTELEIMKRAQMYIESLAKGVDPLTGRAVKEDDIVNNVRISRCLFYVSDVLKKVIDSGAAAQERKAAPANGKAPFSLTPEQILSLTPDSGELSAAKIAAKINELVDAEKMHKLTAASLTSWLAEAGMLCETVSPSGARRKIPTDSGRALGLRESTLQDPVRGNIRYVVYNSEAQQFIFDNLEAVAEVCRRERQQKEELRRQQIDNKGKHWSQEEDDLLITMFQQGKTIKDMAARLMRTRGAVKSRLARLGLLDTADPQE